MSGKIYSLENWADISDLDINHMMYGNFIGLQYVFDKTLDLEVLEQSWELLVASFPPLSSRYDKKNKSLRLTRDDTFETAKTDLSLGEYLKADKQDLYRELFVHEPNRKTVYQGKCALAFVRVTNFSDMGCVLGLSINHLITDAAGLNKITQYLCETYNALTFGGSVPVNKFVTKLPEFSFGKELSWQETEAKLKRQGLKTPISLKGLKGYFVRQLVNWSMKKITSQKRLRVSLSPKQVSALKTKALHESGEDWISTNAALCAHFCAIMIELTHGDKVRKPLRIGQLLDLRNRYFSDPKGQQEHFIGNAILIHSEYVELPNYSRSNLTKFFKAMTGDLTADFIRNRMDVIADCLKYDRNYPGLEMLEPLLAVNNQTKIPVYDVSFAGRKPVHVIPQDVGDTLMFFPASNGGVDIYIRDLFHPKRQARLETSNWQAKIYNF